MDGQGQQAVQFGYGLNYLIDTENAVILDVEATPARTYDEAAAMKLAPDGVSVCKMEVQRPLAHGSE
jgi:hypothetical protein